MVRLNAGVDGGSVYFDAVLSFNLVVFRLDLIFFAAGRLFAGR